MQDIFYNNKLYFIPNNWDELNKKQLIKVASILHHPLYSNDLKQYLLLKALINVASFGFGRLHVDGKARMMKYVEWVSDKELFLTYNPIINYRKNIFSETLFAPASNFENLKMVEFHYSEVAYKNLIETDEVDYLNELVAILYRRKKDNYDCELNSDGDFRVPFKAAEIEYHKKIVKGWNTSVKQAILMWYDGCRQSLIKEYEEVYKGSSNTENYYTGLFTMMRSLAGDKYGTFENIENLNVHTAHLECCLLLQEAEEAKSQLNNSQNGL